MDDAIRRYETWMRSQGWRREHWQACLRTARALERYALAEGWERWEQFPRYAFSGALYPLIAQVGRSTAYAYWSRARSFFRYLVDVEEREVVPPERIKLPQRPESRGRPVADEARETILVAPPEDTPQGLRDRLVLALAFYAGLREAEIAGLDIEDLHFRERYITVRQGKWYRDTRAPLPGVLADIVHDWLTHGRPAYRAAARSRALVLSRSRSARITTKALRDITRRYMGAEGVPAYTLHQLRHSLATYMLRAGESVTAVQVALRHRKVQTTLDYSWTAVPTPQEAGQAVDRLFPRQEVPA